MITHGKNIKIFAANSNPDLAARIARAAGASSREVERRDVF